MECIFCRVADGTLAVHTIATTERVVVFADHQPIRPGHLQIIPRAHYPFFDDLPEDLAGEIVATGQRLARHLKAIYRTARVGFVFTGNEIAHCHAHLIPLHSAEDVTSLRYFDRPDAPLPRRDLRVPDAELAAAAAAIRTAFATDERNTHV